MGRGVHREESEHVPGWADEPLAPGAPKDVETRLFRALEPRPQERLLLPPASVSPQRSDLLVSRDSEKSFLPGTGEGQWLPNSVITLASPQQTGASRVTGG